MKLALAVPFAVSLLSLTACGGGSGGGDPVVPPPSTDEVPETLLEGVWDGPCLAAAPPASSRRFVVQVSDRVFSFADITYGDTLCDEDSALREIDTRGTFVEQIPESGRDIADGVPIDLTIEEVILIPRQSMAAARYNEQMLCGSTAWATGVSQDIEGCRDESGTIESNTTVNRTDINLFLVDDGGTPGGTPAERADDTLLLGTVQSIADPADRPEAVDPNLPFSRRPGSLARPSLELLSGPLPRPL